MLEKIYLEEVWNPQIAFPVFGVILCALLVFAFGFKTPAQPPSFDFDDNRKAVRRKQKNTKAEKQGKIVQNGTAQTAATKQAPSSNQDAKIKQKPKDKELLKEQEVKKVKEVKVQQKVAAQKDQLKAQAKGNKKVAPSSKDAKTAPVVVKEEPEDGWTQLLSKKDRKIRRKEDPPTESLKVVSKDIPSKGEGKKKKKIEPKKVEEPEMVQIKTVSEDATTTKKVVKTESSKKEISKENKDDNSVKDKKKSPAPAKTKMDKVLAPKESNEVKTVKTVEVKTVKTVEAKEAKEVKEVKTEEKAQKKVEEFSAKEESNVVFDELGDALQDTRAQKNKKKKARRD